MAASRRTGSTGSVGSSHGAATSSQPRQLPGSACEECRKRKLRCDRKRPQCGTCADAGVVCEINNNRLARGPKKGDLKALRSRIVALERRLSLDHGDAALTLLTGGSVLPTPATDCPAGTSLASSEGGSPTLASPCQNQSIWEDEIHVQVPPLTPSPAHMNFASFKFPLTPPSPPRSTFVDDLMRADLDQLYFDRVHPNIPLFNHSRYFSRSKEADSSDGPNYMLCLQHAMWTLAMAFSSQFESSREMLYTETRQMLEALDLADDDQQPVRLEQVQAWLLLAFYELARSSYRRASISAGRAFRLVQLAGLHNVDGPTRTTEDEDAVLQEEKRRAFWVAYCLDRLISMRSSGPLTLTEEVVGTRLPSPELAFQSGQPIPGCFLSEVLASGDLSFLSPLAQAIVLITTCGRALSHSQVSGVEQAFGSTTLDFWLRHEWLDGMLTRTLDALTIHTPVVPGLADPMLLFAFMMAHATTIFLCQIAAGSGIDSHCRPAVVEYQRRATRAAQEIARLAKSHENIGYFKAHMFMPLAVSFGASHLMTERKRSVDLYQTQPLDSESASRLESDLQDCMQALTKIQSFNNLAKHHLTVMEAQEFTFGL